MNKKTKIFLTSILIILIILPFNLISVTAFLSDNYPLQTDDSIILNALNFLENQQTIEGDIGGLATSAWAAIAISSADLDLQTWGEFVNYLEEKTSMLDSDKATDWERHTLAIVACNKNPYDFAGIDFIEKIESFYDGTQIGSQANIYDDFFGILSLISAGVGKNEPIIQNTMSYIIGKQNSDGGWGDADSTAAALMALISAGQDSDSTVVSNALSFLKTLQASDGGFQSWGTTNSASTSWAVMAITASEQNPTSDEWENNGKNPIDYLLNLQQTDGSFKWSVDQNINPVWMTSYVIPALLGKNYPVKIFEIGIDENNPPNKPIILSGPKNGEAGKTYTYYTKSTDQENDKLQYRFDWDAEGSHSYSGWTDLENSDITISQSHSWKNIGTYKIKAQSKDEHGLISEWSNGYKISITKEDDTDDDTDKDDTQENKTYKIFKPINNSLYINNKKIRDDLKHTWIIGAIDIELNLPGEIKKVEFYINDKLEHIDNESPFEYKLNKKSFFKKTTLKIKTYQNQSDLLVKIDKIINYFNNLIEKHPQILKFTLLKNYYEHIKINIIKQCETIEQDIILINLLPIIHKI